MIRGVGSEVLAVSGPVQLDDMGGVAKAATQSAVLPVVLLHLHQHHDDVVENYDYYDDPLHCSLRGSLGIKKKYKSGQKIGEIGVLQY